jgi:phosphoserine phosphatase
MMTRTLVVDLDGTLIHTDMLHESAFGLLKAAPLSVLKLPWILLTKGKAQLKQWIAQQVDFDPSVLPYNQAFVQWLREQHAMGRRLVLCTASDRSIAEPIAKHLGFFDEVMASDGAVNLEGQHKAKALVEKFGEKGFDYAGNSPPDLEVWHHARKAIVVNASSQLLSDVRAFTEVEEVFEGFNSKFTIWAKALRVHQWLKNALLFVPLLAAHRLADGAAWMSVFWAFVAFSRHRFISPMICSTLRVTDNIPANANDRLLQVQYRCGKGPLQAPCYSYSVAWWGLMWALLFCSGCCFTFC